MEAVNDDDPLAEVLAFLGSPATHGGAAPVRIDTHAAAVFLAGDRALKVKRAVRFPFLDFSTPERRKAACAAELVANRPFAPQLYRGVVAITRGAGGRLALGGDGPPVEWAVEMRRFDETRTLDRLADAGAIDMALADALGHVVAAAHARAPVVAAAPWIAALGDYVGQNAAAFAQRPDLFDAGAAAGLTDRSRAALARLQPLLAARGRAGLVRRGHGDLHLGNIALIDGRPVPFDALEFDETVASGDVLYDLAFLLMDLWERDLPWAANRVLDRWLAETGRREDLDALAALPLFLSLRAAIRAKVTAAKPAAGDAAVARDTAAAKYFRFACVLIDPPPPVLVAVGGLSGTGKSQAARTLAPDLLPVPGAVVLRTDVLRKALSGVGEHDRLPAAAYTAEATARVYATLVEQAARVLRAGHSVVADAVFARPHERAAVEAAAGAAGVRFTGLFLVADLTTRERRVSGRTADASDADAAVARHQETYDVGRLDWARIDASGSPAGTMAALRAALASPRP
ncbi:AAA family ATPase [Rhodoplanes sp. TEM]|uniref:bifunctional aminoglycoside phosphotransferase/ATP-binding protein n=1 Tax=Rhodoplanes TaxID=29407 RepID=UPI00234FC4B8|nr:MULTISPECIES: AAA family ATPase [Rhodoplanes]MDC7986562.1 AAA family ATPase [Rhodoplanes sp. TEM]